MKKILLRLVLLFAAPVLALAGSPSVGQPDVKVVVLREARDVAAFGPVRAGWNGNGLLVVETEVRNKTGHDQEVQVQAVFFDAAGNPIGDEPGNPAAWTTLPVTATSSVPYRAQALSSKAVRVSIRLRLLHRPS